MRKRSNLRFQVWQSGDVNTLLKEFTAPKSATTYLQSLPEERFNQRKHGIHVSVLGVPPYLPFVGSCPPPRATAEEWLHWGLGWAWAGAIDENARKRAAVKTESA